MRIRNQRLTVILVPQGGAKTYSFQARVSLLLAAAGLFVLVCGLVLSFLVSYGRLFAASRHNARLENEVQTLRGHLAQIESIRAELQAGERTRSRVVSIMASRGEGTSPALAAASSGLEAMTDAEDIRAREEDFMRWVPRAWPVRGPVTREFRPASRDARASHLGIDIAAAAGTPVRAAAAGTITHAGWDAEYGYVVVLEHGLGLETRYGHNARLSVSEGDRVERGQLLATVGSTGRSSAPHLHFEIRKGGVPVDPRQYLE